MRQFKRSQSQMTPSAVTSYLNVSGTGGPGVDARFSPRSSRTGRKQFERDDKHLGHKSWRLSLTQKDDKPEIDGDERGSRVDSFHSSERGVQRSAQTECKTLDCVHCRVLGNKIFISWLAGMFRKRDAWQVYFSSQDGKKKKEFRFFQREIFKGLLAAR